MFLGDYIFPLEVKMFTYVFVPIIKKDEFLLLVSLLWMLVSQQKVNLEEKKCVHKQCLFF